MEQLIYEINGKKYLLFEVPILKKTASKLDVLCVKYDCITQGAKEVHCGGLFTNTLLAAKILVPEENVMAFNKEI